MKYGLLVITCLLTITACSGPSKEELRRMQMLEAQRAEQAALEAQRDRLHAAVLRHWHGPLATDCWSNDWIND